LRLAVVTPFVDRQHGTERALAELLDRLSREYGCEIHLYAERVADLSVISPPDEKPVILSRSKDGEGSQLSPNRPTQQDPGAIAKNAGAASPVGSITWHRVPSIPGPHLFKFLFWILANTAMRWWHRVARGQRVDLVLSPGINCLDADFIIVHALFRRLRALSAEPSAQSDAGEAQSVGLLRRLHRRAYYATVAALERIVYSNRKTRLAAVSRRTADLLGRYFNRTDVTVIYNGIDTFKFSVPARLARRQGARYRRNFSEKELVLLLIGNDWRVKGLPTILAAMAATRDLPLRLIVVGSDVAAIFQHNAQQLGIADRGLVFDTQQLAAQYAMMGDGLALLDPLLFHEEIKAGRLVRPFDLWLDEGYGYYLTTHPEDLSNEAVALFRSWLIARFSGGAPAPAPEPEPAAEGTKLQAAPAEPPKLRAAK